MTRASPDRERSSLLVHLYVDCIDTLHRTRPRHRRRRRAVLARLFRRQGGTGQRRPGAPWPAPVQRRATGEGIERCRPPFARIGGT